MKNILISSLLILLVAAGTSCKKYLDVQPKQTVGENLVVTSLDGLSKATTGAFSQLQSGNLYGGGIISNSELMADHVVSSNISDFSLNQLVTHQLNSFNGQAGGMWNDAYHAILIANTVLKYLPNFEAQNKAQVSILRGECYFIRGIMYYELVRMFAQPSGFTGDNSHLGVPLVLLPGSAYEQQSNPRATVAQVYAQVISDLQAAEPLLPANRSARASRYAAEAFMAKAYFSQSKYKSAKTYADMVISGGFALNDSVGTIYQDFAVGQSPDPEAVFQIINEANDIDNGSLYGKFWPQASSHNPVPNYTLNTPLVSMILTAQAVGDRRFSLYKKSALGGLWFTKKYQYPYANVTVIRLAEIYLLRAECEAQPEIGDNIAAQADVNLVRARAGLAPNNSNTGQALIDFIRAERTMELALEGDHFFEGKRQKINFQCVGYTPAGLNWNDNALVYPIPQQEVDENKNMVQNPGY